MLTLTEEAQLRELLAAIEAANRGESVRRLEARGSNQLLDQLAAAFNAHSELNSRFSGEVSRVLAATLKGDFIQRASDRSDGPPLNDDMLAVFRLTNALVERVTRFSNDMRHIADALSIESRLGLEIDTGDYEGVWQETTYSVNTVSRRVAEFIRELTVVTTAVARGDLTRTITVDVSGDLLELKTTVNIMVERLRAFRTELSKVAREVGWDQAPVTDPRANDLAGVWRDISQNMSFTERLAQASKNKSEFLAIVSHELRTPLNSLLILANVLSENREERLSAKEVQYAKTIHSSGADLLALINEILDLSKVEAGQMQLDVRDVSLVEVTGAIERIFRPVAEQKGLEFVVTVDEGLPDRLETDSQRLLQVLKNLLANAFKFTDAGRVELHLSSASDRELEELRHTGDVVAFRVTDTGIGIPKDKQESIFEPFRQADALTSRTYGGTGLGLSICRELSRLLGGEVHLVSDTGQGSTFTLLLPARYAADATEAGARPNAVLLSQSSLSKEPTLIVARDEVPSRSLAGRKVLVVDDDIRHVFALTGVLEDRGSEVLHAQDGREGVEVLKQHPDLDAVLMDIKMPGMNGYEAMREIRSDPRFADLPIIAVAAVGSTDDARKCVEAGASSYLPKPVDVSRLVELLRPH